MELTNQFSVKVPIAEAWAVLTDLERVAPCMPGFELQDVEGGEYRGVVKVKVGPMIAQYKGVASFRELDEAAYRAVVRAEGRETRGQGNAAATVTATLEPIDEGTQVTMHTDLTISGRVAQFGRGVLADVSGKLLREFVEALEADVLKGAAGVERGAPGAAAAESETDARGEEERAAEPRRREPSAAREPVDLLAAAGPSVLKRVAPLVLALVVVTVLWLLLRA